MLPAGAPLPGQQRGTDRLGTCQRSDLVTKELLVELGLPGVEVSLAACDAGEGLDDIVVGGTIAEGTAVAESANGNVDKLRVGLRATRSNLVCHNLSPV